MPEDKTIEEIDIVPVLGSVKDSDLKFLLTTMWNEITFLKKQITDLQNQTSDVDTRTYGLRVVGRPPM